MYLIFLINVLVLTVSYNLLEKSVQIDNLTEFGHYILMSPHLEKLRYIIIPNDPKNHSVKLARL